MIIHLILDFPDIPLLYPFILYDFVILEEPLLFWFDLLFSDPVVIMTELIGVVILIFMVINNKLYDRKAINEYLKGSYQTIITKEE